MTADGQRIVSATLRGRLTGESTSGPAALSFDGFELLVKDERAAARLFSRMSEAKARGCREFRICLAFPANDHSIVKTDGRRGKRARIRQGS